MTRNRRINLMDRKYHIRVKARSGKAVLVTDEEQHPGLACWVPVSQIQTYLENDWIIPAPFTVADPKWFDPQTHRAPGRPKESSEVQTVRLNQPSPQPASEPIKPPTTPEGYTVSSTSGQLPLSKITAQQRSEWPDTLQGWHKIEDEGQDHPLYWQAKAHIRRIRDDFAEQQHDELLAAIQQLIGVINVLDSELRLLVKHVYREQLVNNG